MISPEKNYKRHSQRATFSWPLASTVILSNSRSSRRKISALGRSKSWQHQCRAAFTSTISGASEVMYSNENLISIWAIVSTLSYKSRVFIFPSHPAKSNRPEFLVNKISCDGFHKLPRQFVRNDFHHITCVGCDTKMRIEATFPWACLRTRGLGDVSWISTVFGRQQFVAPCFVAPALQQSCWRDVHLLKSSWWWRQHSCGKHLQFPGNSRSTRYSTDVPLKSVKFINMATEITSSSRSQTSDPISYNLSTWNNGPTWWITQIMSCKIPCHQASVSASDTSIFGFFGVQNPKNTTISGSEQLLVNVFLRKKAQNHGQSLIIHMKLATTTSLSWPSCSGARGVAENTHRLDPSKIQIHSSQDSPCKASP